jgi:hypothetical protein
MTSVEVAAAIFNDTGESGHFGCSVVMRELVRRLGEHGVSIAWRHRVGEDWRQDRTAQQGCNGAKLVVVNGEGTIHHSAERARAAALAQVGSFARDRLNVPAFLVNATIFAIDGRAAENLRAFTRIWVRDSASQSELSQYGIPSEVAPDLAVTASFPAQNARNGICGTDSVSAEVTAAIEQRCRREGWPYRPMKWQRKGQPTPKVIPTPADYASYLSAHRLVMAGRYHAVCFCLATRTPFVAADSNTPKISSLLHDVFGSNRRVVTLHEIESAKLDRFAEWSPDEEEALGRFLARAERSADTMAAAIGDAA